MALSVYTETTDPDRKNEFYKIITGTPAILKSVLCHFNFDKRPTPVPFFANQKNPESDFGFHVRVTASLLCTISGYAKVHRGALLLESRSNLSVQKYELHEI